MKLLDLASPVSSCLVRGELNRTLSTAFMFDSISAELTVTEPNVRTVEDKPDARKKKKKNSLCGGFSWSSQPIKIKLSEEAAERRKRVKPTHLVDSQPFYSKNNKKFMIHAPTMPAFSPSQLQKKVFFLLTEPLVSKRLYFLLVCKVVCVT